MREWRGVAVLSEKPSPIKYHFPITSESEKSNITSLRAMKLCLVFCIPWSWTGPKDKTSWHSDQWWTRYSRDLWLNYAQRSWDNDTIKVPIFNLSDSAFEAIWKELHSSKTGQCGGWSVKSWKCIQCSSNFAFFRLHLLARKVFDLLIVRANPPNPDTDLSCQDG